MSAVSAQEERAHFSEILMRVEAGETVVVTRRNHPIAEFRPVAQPLTKRRLGAFDGEFEIPPDAFAPLNQVELELWSGE